MSTKIVDRIVRPSGLPGLADFLASELPASDPQSLLFHVYQQRAAGLLTPNWCGQATTRCRKPADIDARLLHLLTFETTRIFEAIDLSPVNPLA
jgi:hypothetical protein